MSEVHNFEQQNTNFIIFIIVYFSLFLKIIPRVLLPLDNISLSVSGNMPTSRISHVRHYLFVNIQVLFYE